MRTAPGVILLGVWVAASGCLSVGARKELRPQSTEPWRVALDFSVKEYIPANKAFVLNLSEADRVRNTYAQAFSSRGWQIVAEDADSADYIVMIGGDVERRESGPATLWLSKLIVQLFHKSPVRVFVPRNLPEEHGWLRDGLVLWRDALLRPMLRPTPFVLDADLTAYARFDADFLSKCMRGPASDRPPRE